MISELSRRQMKKETKKTVSKKVKKAKLKVTSPKARKPVKDARKRPKKRTASEMHASRCNICKSPYCAEIEDRVKNWDAVISIAEDYPGISRQGIDRHAKATGLYRERDKNRQGRLLAMLNDAHNRGIKIETGAEYMRALELQARQHGDLVEKIDVSGNIIFKSDDELAERLNNIIAIGKTSA